MCFYFTLEFLIHLDLFSVFVGKKAAPAEYATNPFSSKSKYETEISRCASRSPNNAEFGHFTFLFSRGRQRNIPRIIMHVHSYCSALQILFGDVLVSVAVVFCVRSLFLVPLASTSLLLFSSEQQSSYRPYTVFPQEFCDLYFHFCLA